MAFLTPQTFIAAIPDYAYRVVAPVRPHNPMSIASGVFMAVMKVPDTHISSGGAVISGVATVAGANSGDLVAILLNEAGEFIAQKKVAAGAYMFRGLVPGNYAVVFLDRTGAYRAKVAHTVTYATMIPAGQSYNFGGYPGQVISVDVSVMGGKAPIVYTASAPLPAGLTLVGSTVQGTLTTEATYSGNIVATDAQGSTSVVPFTGQTIDGYRYYRYDFTASNDATYVGVQEFQLVAADGSLVPWTNTTATASGQADTNHVPSYANDGGLTSGQPWASAAGTASNCWWQVDMGNHTATPASYRIWARPGSQHQAPKTWAFKGSKDGVTWTTLDTRTNETAWQSNQRRDYAIAGQTQPAHVVTQLAHFDGANGATAYTDETGIPWTFFGNAQISTATPLVGSASMLFDGAGDYLQASNHPGLDFGTGDFCIEGFAKWNALTNAGIFHLFTSLPSSSSGLAMSWNGANMGCYTNGANNQWAYALAANTLYHWAAYRKGASTYFAINGTIVGVAYTPDWDITGLHLFLGAYYSTNYTFNGRIDELRIIKGSSPYGHANFTPPTAPFA